MGKLRNYLLGVMVLTIFAACSKDDESKMMETATLSFGPVLNDFLKEATAKQALEDLPECSDEAPAYVNIVLSTEGSSIVGTEEEPFRVDLADGQLFTEEVPELVLVPGTYSLDYFAVYSGDDQLLWVAPRGGTMADFLDDALPQVLELGPGAKKYAEVPVVCFDNRIANEYGYLFFDIEGTEAMEFCLFGNYCNEAGIHFPAHFEVNVWSYAEGETGILLHSEQNEVSLDENGDYAGTTVCMALPDSQEADEYYVEITLLSSDAYGEVSEEVIRSGVITDDDVRSLFRGEDAMDAYHFREGTCSMGDTPALFDEGDDIVCDPENPEADCDGDGVVNEDDTCSDTSSGSDVDEKGCEVTCDAEDPEADCDNDGVKNGDDSCPGTADGTSVDENGCEVTGECDAEDPEADCDNDGVKNADDKCLDTDPGVAVDTEGCESISVPGRDIVVLNDINIFDPTAMEDPDNLKFTQNLVNFTTSGSRNGGSTFMIDLGKGSVCDFHDCEGVMVSFLEAIEDEGFSVEKIQSTEGGLTEIPSDVKILMLVMPEYAYTVDEINTLKKFAAEGGRIIFMGEHEGAYSQISVENDFLLQMGAVLHNTGGSVDCNAYYPAQPSTGEIHPVMQGVDEISIGCASVIEPGEGDFPLFYDSSGTYVLGGVAKIDTAPISENKRQGANHHLTAPKEKLKNPRSLTGF